MKDRLHFILPDSAPLRAAVMDAVMAAPPGYKVDIGPETRTDAMNRLFHKICGILSENVEFAGKMRTVQQWKVLLVSGHAEATGNQSDMVEGIEGELVNLRESTAQMGIKRMSSLIDYALYFCAENGIDVNYEKNCINS